jgi:Arc/MetJ-type ribon-helix-helix transcriptional regulator
MKTMRTKKERKKPPMKNVTLNIPEVYNRDLELLRRKGFISSRSEGIRKAVREFLKIEMNAIKLLRYGEVKQRI